MSGEYYIVTGVIVAIVLLILLSTYNGLMQLRQEVRVAWSQMDEQLKSRYLLVPILVNLAQSVGGRDGEIAAKLAAMSAAKNEAAVALNPVQLANAEAALSIGIQEVLAMAEREESLKNNPRFTELRQQLIASENLIAQSSRRYNDRVDALNASMHSFPYALTARAIGLRMQPMFGI